MKRLNEFKLKYKLTGFKSFCGNCRYYKTLWYEEFCNKRRLPEWFLGAKLIKYGEEKVRVCKHYETFK